MKPVFITQAFRLAFQAQADHFFAVQTLHPDAGSRLQKLADDLFERIIPSIERTPGIGRLFQVSQLRDANSSEQQQEAQLLESLMPDLAKSAAVVLEYVDRQFTILYVVTPDQTYLINIKHHKQSQYG